MRRLQINVAARNALAVRFAIVPGFLIDDVLPQGLCASEITCVQFCYTFASHERRVYECVFVFACLLPMASS